MIMRPDNGVDFLQWDAILNENVRDAVRGVDFPITFRVCAKVPEGWSKILKVFSKGEVKQ